MNKQCLGYILLLLLCCITPFLTKAQSDSTRMLPGVELNNSAFCLRISNGMQRNYFVELGVSRTSFVGSGHGIHGFEYFATATYLPSFKKDGDQVALTANLPVYNRNRIKNTGKWFWQ